ncbi:glycoside hydrolase family 76 protein [Parabacteroides sp.]
MNKQISILLLLLLSLAAYGKEGSPFTEKMNNSLQRSLSWRNDTTGIWESAGWWNSANVLTAVIRYAEVTQDKNLYPVIDDVFEKSKHYQVKSEDGTHSHYCDNYINDYYDDEGWWALAWIEAFKLTGKQKYLDMATVIFEDMTTGWSNECGGGIFWKKNPLHYKNSIANNLFTLTAIRLYHATQQPVYLDWFKKNLDWYMQTGMINTDIYQIEDGTGKDCQPNRNSHYTYNQGVAIAVLAEAYRQYDDKSYLELAEKVAQATIGKQLVTEDGILREMNEKVATSNDGVQFKGIFIRHLSFLYEVTKNEDYKKFIIRNANSIVTNDYDPASQSFGCYWYGPFRAENAAANSSALECVIEAFELSK